MQNTITRYLLFVVLIAIPPALLIYAGQTEYIIAKFWVLFGFLGVLTFMLIITVLIVQQKNKELYTAAFLATTTVKILATLFFVLFFLRKNHVDKYAFAGDFFYVYFLNTGFEVYGLLRNLRNQNLR
jgi:glucan phosphoethanolaminetransferase (alkaline phosphatase superfamily)